MAVKRKNRIISQVVGLTVFGVAMGFLEAAVVVYLRLLYYPDGFYFPLKSMDLERLSLEYLREISTIIMLMSIGMVSGRTFPERLSYFLYSFGIWDIFYYVWLKILLSWPSSLFTWDILFLIPVVWVGPVLAPLVCSLTLIAIAVGIWYTQRSNNPVTIGWFAGILFFTGSFMLFVTFVWDFTRMIVEGNFVSRFWTLSNDPEFQRFISHYTPVDYNWTLFILGEILILTALAVLLRRNSRAKPSPFKG
jgi:hypothetical protein